MKPLAKTAQGKFFRPAPVAPGAPLTAVKNRQQRTALNDACEEYRANLTIVGELTKRNKELMGTTIKPILDSLPDNKVFGDEWQAIRTSRTTSKIEPQLLLEQGVTVQQIEKATVTSESVSYSIRERKTEGDNDEAEG